MLLLLACAPTTLPVDPPARPDDDETALASLAADHTVYTEGTFVHGDQELTVGVRHVDDLRGE